ncbi:MAG: hypothetical protein QM783_09515 [Phycisphaerales bacterium]
MPDLDPHPLSLYDDPMRSALRQLAEAHAISETLNQRIGALELELEALKGPAAEEAPSGFAATVNHYCPVMKKNVLGKFTATEHTVQFEGKTVGFCCDDCPETWKEMTEVEKRAALKAVLEKK